MRINGWFAGLMVLAAPVIAAAAPADGISDTIGRIPEPETLALLAAGVIALIVSHRRGRK